MLCVLRGQENHDFNGFAQGVKIIGHLRRLPTRRHVLCGVNGTSEIVARRQRRGLMQIKLQTRYARHT